MEKKGPSVPHIKEGWGPCPESQAGRWGKGKKPEVNFLPASNPQGSGNQPAKRPQQAGPHPTEVRGLNRSPGGAYRPTLGRITRPGLPWQPGLSARQAARRRSALAGVPHNPAAGAGTGQRHGHQKFYRGTLRGAEPQVGQGFPLDPGMSCQKPSTRGRGPREGAGWDRGRMTRGRMGVQGGRLGLLPHPSSMALPELAHPQLGWFI